MENSVADEEMGGHAAAGKTQPVAKDAPGGVIDAEALLAGRREIQIAFRGQVYRLSITSGGKLLLTK